MTRCFGLLGLRETVILAPSLVTISPFLELSVEGRGYVCVKDRTHV